MDRPAVGPATQESLLVDDKVVDRMQSGDHLITPAMGPIPPSPIRKLPDTRKVSLAQRARSKSLVFDFPIPELDDDDGPFVARVKHPSIMSILETGSTPPVIRQALDKVLSDQTTAKGIQDAATDLVEESPSEALAFLLQVVNHMVIVGFVEPLVVATTEEEESTDDSIALERIPVEARMRYWNLTQNEMKEVADSAATFPGKAGEPGDAGLDLRTDGVSSE